MIPTPSGTRVWLAAGPRAVAQRWSGALLLTLALLSKETAVAAPIVLGALMILFPAAFPATRRNQAAWWAASARMAASLRWNCPRR